MRSGRAATCYYAAGRGPADPNVHIADIRPEQVRNGRLYEGVPAVVGTGDMRSAGLPGDPLGGKEMATIPSGGWLFLVGFASNSTAEMQIVLLLVA